MLLGYNENTLLVMSGVSTHWSFLTDSNVSYTFYIYLSIDSKTSLNFQHYLLINIIILALAQQLESDAANLVDRFP